MPVQNYYRGDHVLVQDNPSLWYVDNASEVFFNGKPRIVLRNKLSGASKLLHVPVDQVTLGRRGHHFKYEFGEPIEFANLQEAADFWNERGLQRYVVNPASQLKNWWTVDQALATLKRGGAHGFCPKQGTPSVLFGYKLLEPVPAQYVVSMTQWVKRILVKQAA